MRSRFGVVIDPFAPAALGPVPLRNRFIKAATFEGRTPRRVVTPDLIDFHRQFAAAGVGMTTVAYCAVTRAGSTDGHHGVWRAEHRRSPGVIDNDFSGSFARPGPPGRDPPQSDALDAPGLGG